MDRQPFNPTNPQNVYPQATQQQYPQAPMQQVGAKMNTAPVQQIGAYTQPPPVIGGYPHLQQYQQQPQAALLQQPPAMIHQQELPGNDEERPRCRMCNRFKSCCGKLRCGKVGIFVTIVLFLLHFMLIPHFPPVLPLLSSMISCLCIFKKVLRKKLTPLFFSEEPKKVKYVKHLGIYSIVMLHLGLLNLTIGFFPFVVYPAFIWGAFLLLHTFKTFVPKYSRGTCFGVHFAIWLALFGIVFFTTVYACSLSNMHFVRRHHERRGRHHERSGRHHRGHHVQAHGKGHHGKPHGKPEHGKPEHGKPEHGKPEHGKPHHGKPHHGKPEHGKPEHGKSEAPQERLMGLAQKHPHENDPEEPKEDNDDNDDDNRRHRHHGHHNPSCFVFNGSIPVFFIFGLWGVVVYLHKRRADKKWARSQAELPVETPVVNADLQEIQQ